MNFKTAFLFPGQSNQHVGMGLELYQHHVAMRRRLDEASRILGFDLDRLCFEGPQEELNQDLNCQLAVYVHSCAVSDILADQGICADIVSGYSSGFYAAAYAAGCFDFAYGLEIVKEAGKYLLAQAQTFKGAMAVIFGLTPQQVHTLCAAVGDLQPAIFNTPRQIVISGLSAKAQAAVDQAIAQGALDAYLLPAATAYHSRFMAMAAEQLFEFIDVSRLKTPQTPLISYSTLDPVKDGQDLGKVIAAQLSGPVRWVELIQQMRQIGVQHAVEVGPGKVICRAARWIDRNLTVLPTGSAAEINAVVAELTQKNKKGT